jgi:hypothetical protein
LSQSDEAKASIIRIFLEEVNKIDINNISSASTSVVHLFKTLTKELELGDGVEKKHDEVRNFKPGLIVGETFEDKDWSELCYIWSSRRLPHHRG